MSDFGVPPGAAVDEAESNNKTWIGRRQQTPQSLHYPISICIQPRLVGEPPDAYLLKDVVAILVTAVVQDLLTEEHDGDWMVERVAGNRLRRYVEARCSPMLPAVKVWANDITLDLLGGNDDDGRRFRCAPVLVIR
jgi:hypothetical protein